MLSDIRYALRALRQSRGFTAAALLALALGIGANTAMFSVVYAVLLKPLPYKAPDRLVWVTQNNKRFKAELVIAADFVDWRAQSHSFDPLAALAVYDSTVGGVADPFNIRTCRLSEPVSRIFGVQPALGRDFLPEEVKLDAAPSSAIISDHFFRSFFHGNRAALGARLVMNDQPFTVVGILPPELRLPLPSPFGPQIETEVLIPTVFRSENARRNARSMSIVQVIGRLRPGVSVAAARAELSAIEVRIPQPPFVHTGEQELVVMPLRDRILGNAGRSLSILLGAVGFVLLIACANVANLLLARAAARRREIAVRMALGASRGRLVRQALTESMVLAVTGGAAGLLLAAWWLRLIVNWNAVVVPRLHDASIDPAVLAFAFAVSALTGVVFGLAPALAAARGNVNDALKSSGTVVARRRLRGVLVVAEVALSLVLVTGAGLMVKSLWVMHAATTAAAPERVLTAALQIDNPRYRDPEQSDAFMSDFLARLQSLPGVRAAAGSNGGGSMMLEVEGSRVQPINSDMFTVTPRYFTAAGIRLLKGRLLGDSDKVGPAVLLVNETLARHLTPGYPAETPVGLRVPMAKPGGGPNDRIPVTIVGVVSDFRSSKLDAPVEPQIFLPAGRSPWRFGVEIMVRANSDPTALVGAVRTLGRGDGIALLKPQTLADRLDASIAPRRFEMTLLIVFASLALLLALVGIYGVVAYMVTQRTREIGLRVALGAQRADVVRMVLGGGLKLVCGGVAVGLAAALGLTRVMESFLYDVRATDAATFAAASVLLVAVAAMAAWIPARRASGVDPLVALRED